MAANNRNDLTSSGILQEWLNREFLKNFDPNLYFALLTLGEVKSSLNKRGTPHA